MSIQDELKDKEEVKKDEYFNMKERLDDRYFELFCDVFDDARKKLLSNGKKILGTEYEETYDRLIDERRNLERMRESFSASDEIVALKDRLTLLKEKLIECSSESEKIVIRSEMDDVLKTIAQKNIGNFGEMSKKKAELDELAKKLQSIVDEKKELLANAEKELLADAKTRFSTIVSSYREELNALCDAFEITDEEEKLPFSEWLDLNMRLIDFDRDKLKEAREKKRNDCCCREKHVHYSKGEKPSGGNGRYFNSHDEKGEKN